VTSNQTDHHGASQPSTPILHNLVLFGGVLRGLGMDVGAGNMLDLVRAIGFAPMGRKQDFKQAARCILVHRKQDLPLFDEAFDVFWRKPATGETTMDLRSMGEQRRFRKPQVGPPPPGQESDPDANPEDDGGEVDRVDLNRTYSVREVLREKDFAQFTAREVQDARHMMSQLSWQLGQRRTRRLTPGPGAHLDLRATLRRNLKSGGELLELSYRQPKDKLRPLVLICDISGSMERYTKMLLHFIHSISSDLDRVEAFVFATRLTRITRHLHYRGVDQAVTEVSKAVQDWAGGTRIGEAIKTFNYRWLRRVVRGGAVVLVISDGWDRGEPDLLSQEMSRLRRSCHRLIWLNPLLGSESYEPLTRGMQAALPYIDDFLPIHNFNSLEALGRHLNRLGPRRGVGHLHHSTVPEEPVPVAAAPASEPKGRRPDPANNPTFRHPLWGRER
jgi:uncharacterized protein with von Willebrand factor type A (vWA) domain